ncbi:hypothetical protein U9M48_010742 [Paspalum notatum var. saurae]|uniref:DDE Tnp4 domain-containing protein n=1 Tax=Paspalum notatum var. saurae TaxID=547442 RepID=A0AAQ3WGN2_PASNO
MENTTEFNRKLAFMVACMVAYWAAIISLTNRGNLVMYSVMERNRDRMKYHEKLYCGQDSDCVILRMRDSDCVILRMSKHVFFKLCSKFRSMDALRDTWHCTVEEQVAMFLQTVGHKKKNRDIKFHFTRSGETVSRYFNEVLYAIGQLGPEMLRHRSMDVPSKIRNNQRFYPFFEDCIGAIDGTHISCTVLAKIADRFRGRKPFTTQNVLVVVDFDLMFTYVSAGWEGSAHDSTVLRHSLDHPNGLRVPEGLPSHDGEFIFSGKHATGEFSVPQTPFDHPSKLDEADPIGNRTTQYQINGDVDPSHHYDSDTLPGSESPTTPVSTKRKSEEKEKKGKRSKRDFSAVQEVTGAMNNMSDTMRFTHVTDPNEGIYKVIDDMQEYPLLVRLDLQTFLAQNANITSMLKGRPEKAIKQWVAQWVMGRYHSEVETS